MVTAQPTLQDTSDFSPVLGGPLYQLWRRSSLSGPALELVRRRVVTAIALTWVPLALLSILEGRAWSGVALSFLRDIETHIRFLVALPVLIASELEVHQRIRSAVKRLLDGNVIAPEDVPKFRAAIDTASRIRNSITIETALLIFVWTVGQWLWHTHIALTEPSWYATPHGGTFRLTLAGHWDQFVSVPAFQFILLRWYFRIFIWFGFLLRISRFHLQLLPAHPDRMGGLGFLGESTMAFSPVLFAQGALLSGLIASRILFENENLFSFKILIATWVVFFVLVVLCPLLMFVPQLARAKRRGLEEYGVLSSIYVADFNKKWLPGGAKGEAILGTADIQSLADLINSYAVVRRMRVVPFGLDEVKQLVVAAAAPVLPLILTIMPFSELMKRIFKILF